MTLDLSKYLNKRYDDTDYNCLHFACDIYRDLTTIDMSADVRGLLTGRNHRHIDIAQLRRFTPIPNPIAPCLAIMHSDVMHAGIYYDNKIIHLTECGVQCVPPHLAEIRHGRIKYYAI